MSDLEPGVDAGVDAGDGLDLSPRAPRAGRSKRRRLGGSIVLVLVIVALAFVVFQTLSGAAFSFYNVDEAVERRGELGDERFQVQGTPIGNAREAGIDGETTVAFTIVFNGVEADVIHVGEPAELFQSGVPVVLQGYWDAVPPIDFELSGGADDGFVFRSDRMVVKHDDEYTEDNRDRIAEAYEGADGDVTE